MLCTLRDVSFPNADLAFGVNDQSTVEVQKYVEYCCTIERDQLGLSSLTW